MNPKSLVFWAVVVACSSVPGRAAAQAPPARVHLIFDEQRIPDNLRAQLYRVILASVPESDWPVVEVGTRTQIPTLLDQYFDILPETPNTQRMLTAAVAAANPGQLVNPGGRTVVPGAVRLPPVPVRANTVYGQSVDSRVFDPSDGSYQLKSNQGIRIERQAGVISPIKGPDIRRGAKYTEVVVPLTNDVRVALQQLDAAPNAVVANDPGNALATVNFLHGQPTACDDAEHWLRKSPYRAAVTFAPDQVEKLKTVAEGLPLTLIDWNISDAAGHGAKVRAVVSEVLGSLGLQGLDTEAFVKTIELNPRKNQQQLTTILTDYQALLGDLGPMVEPSLKWVREHVPEAPNALSQSIPAPLLAAVLWHAFDRAGAVNLSFNTNSPSIALLTKTTIGKGSAFGAFAAGNNGTEISRSLHPQAEASRWSNVVNVTHGTLAGGITGDVSNRPNNIFVNLLGPGCGYRTSPLAPADTGSSFASPYVLTLAWVQMLHGTLASTLKRALLTASDPRFDFADKVESGGLFDGALLLMPPAQHVIDGTGNFEAVTDLSFSMTFDTGDAEIGINSDKHSGQGYAIAFRSCGVADLCAVARNLDKDGRPQVRAGKVTAISLRAVTANRQIDAGTAESLLKQVRLLRF